VFIGLAILLLALLQFSAVPLIVILYLILSLIFRKTDNLNEL
jgi:phage shock protein PspC (stress-responsive transcriptional regulator)